MHKLGYFLGFLFIGAVSVLSYALFTDTAFADCERCVPGQDENTAINAGGYLVYRDKEYNKTSNACGNNDEGEDIRNYAGDSDCKKHYYKVDEGSSSCDSYIVLDKGLNHSQTGKYLRREWKTMGASCYVTETRDVQYKTREKLQEEIKADERYDLRKARWDTLKSNSRGVCQQVDKDNVTDCQAKLESAFNSCYDSLAAGHNGGRQDVDEDALISCMAQKTGYEKSQLRYLFVQRYNSDVSSKCDVPGLGWVICWVSKFMAKVVDGLFTVLETMLRTPSLDQTKDGGKELHKMWAFFRNIANVALIITMLIIIYSQVTSTGIGNYGVKKLLPRMIVGAILINISYTICAIIVDLSNISGAAIQDLLSEVAKNYPVKPDFSSWATVVAIGLVGAAGVVILNTFALAPILLAGFLALLTTVVILTIRQGLIVIFVMIAPLAFAFNILPSGQKWFSRWWSNFLILAGLYPIIGFIFGATQVAAGVISAGSPQSNDPSVIILFAVFCLAVQSVPFFVVPLLLKFGGSILSMITGALNNASSGLRKNAEDRTNTWSENRKKVRTTNALAYGGGGLRGAMARRSNKKKYIQGQHEKDLKSPTSGAFGEFVGNDNATARALARQRQKNAGYGEGEEAYARSLRNAGAIEMQLNVSDIDAAEARWVHEKYSTDDLRSVAFEGKDREGNAVTENERAAAIRKLASQGNLDDIHKLIDDMSKVNTATQTLDALATGIERSGASASAAHLGPQGTQMIRSGALTNSPDAVGSLYTAAANSGVYNPETLSRQSSKSMRGLANSVPSLDNHVVESLRKSREVVQSSEKLSSRWSSNTKSQAARI